MKKRRTKVPIEPAADLQVQSNRTCCICRVPRKYVQIHHIDENPANHAANNLALLCLECHNDTLIQGGFGRRLDAETVKRFRDEWHELVAARGSQPQSGSKPPLQNANLEGLQHTLDEIDVIQSSGQRARGPHRNASLEKLRRTLDEIDEIQSGRNRTSQNP